MRVQPETVIIIIQNKNIKKHKVDTACDFSIQ